MSTSAKWRPPRPLRGRNSGRLTNTCDAPAVGQRARSLRPPRRLHCAHTRRTHIVSACGTLCLVAPRACLPARLPPPHEGRAPPLLPSFPFGTAS